MKHVFYPRNTNGKDYFVGDIHGCFERLAEHLRGFFRPDRDRLFGVGDLGDRGPDSKAVLWWLDQPWFSSTRGNHCQGLIDYHRSMAAGLDHTEHLGRKFTRERMVANGGAWFVNMSPEQRQPYVDAFDTLPLAITVDTELGWVGVVHGEAPVGTDHWGDFIGDLGVEESATVSALLGRKRITTGADDRVQGVRAIVTGHTPVQSPAMLGNHLFIDTGAVYRDHEFTIIDAATLKPVALRPQQLCDPKIIRTV